MEMNEHFDNTWQLQTTHHTYKQSFTQFHMCSSRSHPPTTPNKASPPPSTPPTRHHIHTHKSFTHMHAYKVSNPPTTHLQKALLPQAFPSHIYQQNYVKLTKMGERMAKMGWWGGGGRPDPKGEKKGEMSGGGWLLILNGGARVIGGAPTLDAPWLFLVQVAHQVPVRHL